MCSEGFGNLLVWKFAGDMINYFMAKPTDLDLSPYSTVWSDYSQIVVNSLSTNENKDICNNQHVCGEGRDSLYSVPGGH